MITDKNNSVTGLTKEQLTKIYTGEITLDSEVGKGTSVCVRI